MNVARGRGLDWEGKGRERRGEEEENVKGEKRKKRIPLLFILQNFAQSNSFVSLRYLATE